MKLSQLLGESHVVPSHLVGDTEIGSIQLDSRKCTRGSLFVCMPGMTNDSQGFIASAVANGASAALVYDAAGLDLARQQGIPAVALEPSAYRDSIWRLCDTLFDHPTRHMKVVGVTGTNGKTTTAWLLKDMFEQLGLKSAYLGTLGFHLGSSERELSNTTPFAVELFNLLAEARDAGVEALAMEVSSHALAEQRADGVEFDAAVFTNLTQDHLDFHKTMDAYEGAKWRLFSDLPRNSAKRFVGAINVGDPTGKRWATKPEAADWVRYAVVDNVGSFGALAEGVDLEGQALEVQVDRIHLLTQSNEGDHGFYAHLGGAYNVENLLSACAALKALGYTLSNLNEIGPNLRPVPGRFEAVKNDKGFGVLVDYAHTPDALEKLLDAVHPLTTGRVITVFGCGGDRDKTKRPKMARAASERSDLTVVTSDNPRTEDPESIIADVVPGIVAGRGTVTIADRREAITYAINQAAPGDVVVIAGKGHENYQIIGRTKHHMDDRELAREALCARP